MKKYEAMFQIGEVASLLGISRGMILNYENARLITPTVIDEDSGYRYFDSFTIARIQLILDLRRTGMMIPEIEEYLKGKRSAANQIEKLQEQMKSISRAIEQLEVRNKMENNDFSVKEITLPKRCCICRDVVAENVNAAIDAFIGTYKECLDRKLHFAVGSYHFCEFGKSISDDDFYELENIKMKVCICVSEDKAPPDAVIFPETKALSVSFCGNYDKSIAAYEAIRKYMKENSIVEAGFPQELYLEGNFDNSSNKNIVWIVVPFNGDSVSGLQRC